MAKYLSKPCVDIRIDTLQVFRAEDGMTGLWQTYLVIIGVALDEDGKVLQKIHRKDSVGLPGPQNWNSDTAEKDMEDVTAIIKSLFDGIKNEYTTNI